MWQRLFISFAVSLVLADALCGQGASAPAIVTQPVDATTNVDGAAAFRVAANGTPPLSFQWLHDGQPVSGATSDTLVIAHVSAADAGKYSARVVNSFGSNASVAAQLTVQPAPALPIVDLGFHGDAALTGMPTVIWPLADGRVLVAMVSIGIYSFDPDATAQVYRLLADGRIDPTFHVARIQGGEFYVNTGGVIVPPDAAIVRQLLLQPDGRIIIVGIFTTVDGLPRGGIARLNADGTVDRDFAPVLTPVSTPSLYTYSDEPVAALQADGKIVVLNSNPVVGARVVRLLPGGQLDATFAVADGGTALVIDASGRIIIGSGFGRGPAGTGRVIALTKDGQPDASFAPFACDPVQRLYALPNGGVIVGTQFDRGPFTVPRFPTATFKLRADGTLDPSFATRTTLLTTAPAADGTLFLTGKLIAPDGVTETSPNLGVATENGPSNLFAFGSGGQLWVGGRFSFYNGVTTSRIARLNLVASENLAAPRVLAAWADKDVLSYGETVTLHAAPVGPGPLTYTWLWPFNTGVLATTNEPTYTFTPTTTGQTGPYGVRVSNSTGSAEIASITFTLQPAPLRIVAQPRRVSLTPGRWGYMVVTTGPGSPPFSAEWRRDGEILPPDLIGSAGQLYQLSGTAIVFGTVQAAHAGTFVLTLRDNLGHTVTSDPIVVTVGDQSRFTNLSTRAFVGVGEQAAILGFVIPPGQSRTVIVRGIGPGLTAFGLDGVLPDPRIDLFDGQGADIHRDNNWQVWFNGNGEFDKVGAFPLRTTDRDTALHTELPPGNYTVRLSSLSGATGLGLIELYEDDVASDRLLNLSSRVFIDRGANAIAGFAIRGSTDKRVLVRAAGPTLAAFGITGALGNPRLEVRDNAGQLVASNDDWQNQADAAGVSAASASAGAFAFANGSKDAALIASLPPGNYSAIVTGTGSDSGVALVEVYELP